MAELEQATPSPLLEFVSQSIGIDGIKLIETDRSLIFEIDEIPEGHHIMMPSIKTKDDLQSFSKLLAGKEIEVKIGTVKGNYSFFGELTL